MSYFFYIFLFVLSIIGTWQIKKYAIKRSIMDIPNSRSAHTVPTPSVGGVAIIVAFFIGLFGLYFNNLVEQRLYYALLCSLPIVLISLIDDVMILSSRIRFMVQVISSVLAIYFLGGVSSIEFIYFEINGWWINILALISIIWLTNLYNFLDGIDGYAGLEAVTVGLGSFILLGNEIGMVIICSVLGFLFFNWHKASIFMGDVGSTVLGFIFGILVFYDTSEGNIYIWMVLLSLFWFDATLTLIRRYKNGETITQAHKKHAYQRLTQYGWSHDKVVWFALLFNLIFFVLLYFVENVLVVFVLNMIFLYVIVKIIDSKKSFV